MTMKVELCVSAALVCGFAFAGPKDETAAAFWIRFDALPAQCSPLGEHYLAMAKRYYAAPDAGVMKKAVAAMREAYEIRPDSYRREYVKALVEAKEHQAIVDLLAPTFDPQKPDPWTAPQLGDAYYYLGEWEKAVDVYAAFGDKLNPGERMPPNRLDRRVNALYALGRYEECLKAVDKLSDWLVWKDRKAAYRQKLKKLIKVN